jgi:hypothetical protein
MSDPNSYHFFLERAHTKFVELNNKLSPLTLHLFYWIKNKYLIAYIYKMLLGNRNLKILLTIYPISKDGRGKAQLWGNR